MIFFFPEYRLAIEIDERGHLGRDEEKEKERENKIKERLKCEFIRINPDKENFDEYIEFGKINTYIRKSTKKKQKNKKTKKSIEKIKELLRL